MTAMLLEEMSAALKRAATPAAQRWREPYFPRLAALMGLGGGLTRITVTRDGTYEPAEAGGLHAIILPCWEGPAPGLPDTLIDLIAWVPGAGGMYSRLGNAEMLGEWAVYLAEHPLDGESSLTIYPDPGSWARAATWEAKGGHGAVVVDWSAARRRLAHLAEIVVADVALGIRLREALKPPALPPAPRILVNQPDIEVAA